MTSMITVRPEVTSPPPTASPAARACDIGKVYGRGDTAVQALHGRQFRVTQHRGEALTSDLAPVVMATVHPSSILRADDSEAEFSAFVDDLRTVAAHL